MTEPEWLDWDSIRELEGFRVGDQIRARGQHVGIILHLIKAKGRSIAHVHWPTIPFECEGHVNPKGSEQFKDLDTLTKVLERSGEQLALI